MTDTPFIDHREIKRAAAMSKATDSLELIREISPVALLQTSDENAPDEHYGFMVAKDGRAVCRLVDDATAAIVGRKAIRLSEMVAFMDRVSRLGELENAATQAQADYVRLRRLFGVMAAHVIHGETITVKERRAIGALAHELDQMDKDCAEQERKTREENDRFHRERMLGIKITAMKFGLEA